MYYVTTYLDKIAQNPEKMYLSKIIFAFCCWLQATQTSADESLNVAMSPQIYPP